MDTFSFDIPGSVGLTVTVTEQVDGSLRFDLVNKGDGAADLRGLFFDFNDAALLPTLSASGAQVARTASGDDSVVNLGQGVTMQGVDRFDFGVACGTAGIGKDDIAATSFTLRASAGARDLDDVAGVDFGVRFTSVGEHGGARDGSLKLVGTSPEPAGEGPTPPPPFPFPSPFPPDLFPIDLGLVLM